MGKSAIHWEASGGEQLVTIVDGLLGLLLALLLIVLAVVA
jgi:sorbitol-specific phosphotransferase system component IIC